MELKLKEFFEIEPIQKNSMVVIILVFFISFLQLYLFKQNFTNESYFLQITLSISLSICWIVAEIPSYISAVSTTTILKTNVVKKRFMKLLIISFGFSLLFWMVMITFIGSEFNLNIKNFIRLSVTSMVLKGLFFFIRCRFYKSRLKK